MEDYNKIIESLGVRFSSMRNGEMLKPVTIEHIYDVEDTIIYNHGATIKFVADPVNGGSYQMLDKGEMMFIPGGHRIHFAIGRGGDTLTNDEFEKSQASYIKFSEGPLDPNSDSLSFTQFTFEAKVFETVGFFASLKIPAFEIHNAPNIQEKIRLIQAESKGENPGYNRLIKNYTEIVVVEVIRYLISNSKFVEQLVTNATYFKDPRLIDIFAYIKNNLGGDLSNKKLASVANVSEDYVGQYFKVLTSINPQDYIEYQRMEESVNLLRTTKMSIRDIGKEVGYKDTAYFCRRFKMMFGIPAGKMRRRETLLNI